MLEMSHLAQHDVLTDLPNRLMLKDRLAQAIAMALRNQHQLAVLFLDLDGFKHINDSLGHSVGDKLLQAVATRLSSCVRKSDTVSRQGGDEFVILLPEVTHAADAAISAAKIIGELKKAFIIGEQNLCVTASVGISTYPDNGEDPEMLIKNADTAMYHAKQNGRGNYQFFRPDMSLQAVERQSLEGQLRYAMERQELLLHYQPQVNLKTRAITSVEALIRWQHPELVSLFRHAVLMTIASHQQLSQSANGYCDARQTWWIGIDADLTAFRSPSTFRHRISPTKFLRGGLAAANMATSPEMLFELRKLLKQPRPRHAIPSITARMERLKALGVRRQARYFGTAYSSTGLSTKISQPDALKAIKSVVAILFTGLMVNDAIVISAVIPVAAKSQAHEELSPKRRKRSSR